MVTAGSSSNGSPSRPVRSRPVLAGLLLATIAAGLGSRWASDWLPDFVVANVGDVLWTVAAFLALAILMPAVSTARLASLAIAFSFAVEFSQLATPNWLVTFRSTLPGRLLLGTDFVWADLPRYAAGGLLAAAIDFCVAGIRQRRGVKRAATKSG